MQHVGRKFNHRLYLNMLSINSSSPFTKLPTALQDRLENEKRKLKIEILECKGGSGHEMSAEAVRQAVKSHFGEGNVEIRKYDVGSHLASDPLSVLTFGRVTVIQFHNFLARNGHTKIISVLSKVGKVASGIQAPITKKHFRKRYEKSRPDLVISAVPLINGTVLKSLSKQNIPLMVVTTDGDNSMFCANWQQDRDVGPYRYGIPYNSLEIANKVADTVDMSKVRGIGYPLRPGYRTDYSESDREEFRRKHLIKKDEKVVGVMMGGLGGQVMEKYFKSVMSSVNKEKLKDPNNTRFAFFCGNNKKMQETLLNRLKKRGWRCNLSDDRRKVLRNCKSQKQKLSEIQKELKTFTGVSLETISQHIKELEQDKKRNLNSLDPDLQFVIKRAQENVDILVDEFTEFSEKLQSEDIMDEEAQEFIQQFSGKILKVERSYGNIEDDIREFQHPSGAKINVLGFTSDDHEYVAVSDLWVTKTGSSTFNQCLYTQTPMLLDGTSRPLDWEMLNFDLSETYGFGQKVSSFNHFSDQLNRMLNTEVRDTYRKAEREYLEQRTKQTEFGSNIVDLTYELLNEAEERKVQKKNDEEDLRVAKEEKARKWKNLSALHKAEEIFNFTFFTTMAVVKKVVKVALSILFSPLIWFGKNLANYAYFSGFNTPESRQKTRRKQLIKDKGAEPIEGEWEPLSSPISNRPIDAVRIPSTAKSRTGNAVIFVLGKHYQDFHPQNYDHLLEDGADVILFNPSKKNTKVMEADLKEVIKEVRKRDPKQKLMLHGYCIGAHVAAAVASNIAAGEVSGLEPESIPAVIDRGFKDAQEVGAHSNRFVNLPFARKYVNRYYNARFSKMNAHNAPMLFVTPEKGGDQVNHKKNRDFTSEMMTEHNSEKDQVVLLEGGDHWSSWPVSVHNKVKKFLSKEGIIGINYRKVNADDFGGEEKLKKKTSVPWVRGTIVPMFV